MTGAQRAVAKQTFVCNLAGWPFRFTIYVGFDDSCTTWDPHCVE